MCDCNLFFQDEMTLVGYRKYLASQAAPLPLTAAEEELRKMKLSEVQTHSQHMNTERDISTAFSPSAFSIHTLLLGGSSLFRDGRGSASLFQLDTA